MAEEFDRAWWRDHLENGRFPRELWRRLGEHGHLGTMVPRDDGGSGGTVTELALVTEGLAASGFPLLALITGPGLALPVIAASGARSLREKVLARALSGEELIAFSITERDAGSNILAIATRAEVVGDEVVLTGAKVYSSVADIAEHTLIVARTPDPGSDRLGFSVVLVPADAPA